MHFFEELGYTFDPQFTTTDAACMEIDEHIYAMLVTEAFFKRFTPKPLVDAHKQTECSTCVTVESKDEVDAWAEQALSLGATENDVPDMQQGDAM